MGYIIPQAYDIFRSFCFHFVYDSALLSLHTASSIMYQDEQMNNRPMEQRYIQKRKKNAYSWCIFFLNVSYVLLNHDAE